MNLLEQIYRIQEMMGVINESIPKKVIRRLNDLDKYIKLSYIWLNPKSFQNFEEFVDRVVFGATREFVGDALMEDNQFTYDDLVKIRRKLEEHVNKIVVDNYLSELKTYYVDIKNK